MVYISSKEVYLTYAIDIVTRKGQEKQSVQKCPKDRWCTKDRVITVNRTCNFEQNTVDKRNLKVMSASGKRTATNEPNLLTNVWKLLTVLRYIRLRDRMLNVLEQVGP